MKRMTLSAEIDMAQIPRHYYHPRDEYEQAVLCRYENIPTHIYLDIKSAAETVAQHIAQGIIAAQEAGKTFSLAVSGGTSPSPVYEKLVEIYKRGELSFSNVYFFMAYEYYPAVAASATCLSMAEDQFLSFIDIPKENIISPDVYSSRDSVMYAAAQFEKQIEAFGGIDFLLMGIGTTGNLCFNMPGTHLNTRTRLVVLDYTARNDSLSLFNLREEVPSAGISIGLATISEARHVALVAWGESKAEALYASVEGQISTSVPASFLQMHPSTAIYADHSAASLLTRISSPWLVGLDMWNDTLIRRAVTWLCMRINKPILKLTNKDYSDNGLSELIAHFGSAYKANIKIFNDIQHTITGWPGGKPNADDSDRPERETPYPKRVIVFSPHPDDDVISMGGTFRRLVEQGHDVHVAYQTSGNIAVGDEDLIRYLSYIIDVCEHYVPQGGNAIVAEKAKDILKRLTKKEKGAPEPEDVRFMKGTIRREEARSACQHVGVKPENIHFLDLPFYETGAVKKNPPTEADVDIVRELIEAVEPHQIFVAGDLADPHGTHKVCLDVTFEAIEQVKYEAWMRDCYIWMYRGAWAEWKIDNIEMAVPMSPEELRAKRNSILCHRSQMESAPFLGDDARLFWQRAEDRNQATAKLYSDLGLASYEAIEAFVRYKPVYD